MEPYLEFEQEFGKLMQVENVVGCSSGTAALHLALEALQLPLGSYVLCPNYTMIACPRAITLAGLKPLLVDCGDDLLMCPDHVEQLVEEHYDGQGNSDWHPGKRISAIMCVHIFGRQCNMFRLRKATEGYGIRMIEDLAEGHGMEPYPCDASCYSFYRNKVIAGEEGGAVAFGYDSELATRARSLRSLGFTPEHDYTHIPRGHNYRLSNAHARLILASMGDFPANLAARGAIEDLYDHYCPSEIKQPFRAVPWVYDVRIPGLGAEGQRRIVVALHREGLGARFGFKPVSTQAEYREACKGTFRGSERASTEVIYLPIEPGRTGYDVQRAFQIIRGECFREGIMLR